MAKDYSKKENRTYHYAPGTYGHYLEEQMYELYVAIWKIDEQEKIKAGKKPAPLDYKETDEPYREAARRYAAMEHAYQYMSNNGEKLGDAVNEDKLVELSKVYVERESSRVGDARNLFDDGAYQRTRWALRMDGEKPPAIEDIAAKPYADAKRKLSGQYRRFHVENMAGGLENELRQSTHRSFVGTLKSWFVGNSDEYDAVMNKLAKIRKEGLKENSAKELKESIVRYLDIRKDKVRNQEFGRKRFDAMMRGLGKLMEPAEFHEYCRDVVKARQERALKNKTRYTGSIDPEAYLSGKELEDYQAWNLERRRWDVEKYEPTRREDLERIAADMDNEKQLASNRKFLEQLREETLEKSAVEDYVKEHPTVRLEAAGITNNSAGYYGVYIPHFRPGEKEIKELQENWEKERSEEQQQEQKEIKQEPEHPEEKRPKKNAEKKKKEEKIPDPPIEDDLERIAAELDDAERNKENDKLYDEIVDEISVNGCSEERRAEIEQYLRDHPTVRSNVAGALDVLGMTLFHIPKFRPSWDDMREIKESWDEEMEKQKHGNQPTAEPKEVKQKIGKTVVGKLDSLNL